jgi:3D-(3,5/4)-trihydroxycyclohexane-1,2-dione acylhydrolase (decyclizing)
VIVIDTIAKDFPGTGLETSAGEHGYFWDVAVPEVSDREKQRNRYAEYITQIAKQTGVN